MNPNQDSPRYRVFTRTWWRKNPNWPSGREPGPGRKTTIAKNVSYDEALSICKRWNETHKPGLLSRKAEFEQR